MPDLNDYRMKIDETANCKLALMGVWGDACNEAALERAQSIDRAKAAAARSARPAGAHYRQGPTQ